MKQSITPFVTTLLVLLLGTTGPIFSQSNEILDGIIAEDELTYGSASYLLLLGNGLIDEESSFSSAVREMERREYGIPDRTAADPLTLGEYSLLTMHVYSISGGIAWSILRSPRYAVRELNYLGIVQGHAYPNMRLTGERGLRILGRVLALREGGAL